MLPALVNRLSCPGWLLLGPWDLYSVGYSASLLCPALQPLKRRENWHFPQLPILLFPLCRALTSDHWDRQGILCLLLTSLIEETSSLVKLWPATAGTTRSTPNISFIMTTCTSGYGDHRTANAFLLLRSRQIPQTRGPPSIVATKGCSPVHTMLFGHNLRAICDHDIIVRDSIALREFKPHSKFLANHVCFDNLWASSVLLGRFLDYVNKTKSVSTIFERFRLFSENFWIM